MKTALVVHRISAGTADNGQATLRMLSLHAQSRGWHVVEEALVEENAPRRRQHLGLRDPRPDVIVIHHLSRVCTTTPAALRWVRRLLDEGVDLVVLGQGIDTTLWPADLRPKAANLLSALVIVDHRVRSELIRAGLNAGSPPTRHRTAIDLKQLAELWHRGHTYREIATALGTTTAKVSIRSVGRAVRQLKLRGELNAHRRFTSLYNQGKTLGQIGRALQDVDTSQLKAWRDLALDEIH